MLDTLPIDILLNIFGYLRYVNIIKLLTVNKTLNNIINENSKCIEFNNVETIFDKKKIDNIIKKFPKIKLYIDGRTYNNYVDYINNIDELILFNFQDTIPVDISKIKTVRVLDISFCDNIINIDKLRDKDCKILELKCCYSKITDVSSFVNIKNLSLYYNDYLSDISAFKYNNYDFIDLSSCKLIKDFSVFKYCKINEIDLSDTNIEDVSSLSHINIVKLSLCENIKNFNYLSNVEVLELSETNITDISCLNNNKKLCLSSCDNITNFKLTSNRLETLNLSDTKIINIPNIKTLKYLKLSNCNNLNYSNISLLTNLVELDLSYNKNINVNKIIKLLKNTNQLKELHVFNNTTFDLSKS